MDGDLRHRNAHSKYTREEFELVYMRYEELRQQMDARPEFEESTFTMSLTGLTSGSGQVYTYRDANYSKIGRRVFFSGILGMSQKGTLSGDLVILGLPYPVDLGPSGLNQASIHIGYFTGLATAVSSLGATIYNSIISLRAVPAAGGTGTVTLATADITNTFTILLSGHYLVRED